MNNEYGRTGQKSKGFSRGCILAVACFAFMFVASAEAKNQTVKTTTNGSPTKSGGSGGSGTVHVGNVVAAKVGGGTIKVGGLQPDGAKGPGGGIITVP